MFSVDMLSGGRGDSLWIEYGPPDAPYRILIDGGPPETYEDNLGARIAALPEDDRRFELVVVSHIDLDHIGGILELLRDPPPGFSVGDVWFNAYEHLNPGVRGPKQGESLSAHLTEGGYPWNKAFRGGPASIGDATASPDDHEYPTIALPGGMSITLLGPTQARLRRLESEWRKVIEAGGLVPGTAGYVLEEAELADVRAPTAPTNVEALANSMPKDDTSRANGSSIAFLASHDGRRCLFTGDAFSEDMSAVVGALAAREGGSILEVDALKVSHHGGHKNTHRDLIERLACEAFLFSTDGSYYGHPNDESVARVVVHGRQAGRPRLYFNHHSDEPRFWQDPENLNEFPADLVFPDPVERGLRVEL